METIYRRTGIRREIISWLKRGIIPREFRNWITKTIAGNNRGEAMEKVPELAVRVELLNDQKLRVLWREYKDLFIDDYVYRNIRNQRERERIYRELMMKNLIDPHNTVHALEVYNRDFEKIEKTLRDRGLEVLLGYLAENGPYATAKLLGIKL